jgi:hypothetical protein
MDGFAHGFFVDWLTISQAPLHRQFDVSHFLFFMHCSRKEPTTWSQTAAADEQRSIRRMSLPLLQPFQTWPLSSFPGQLQNPAQQAYCQIQRDYQNMHREVNHTQGHKNFSFCEQTLHKGLQTVAWFVGASA